MLWQAAERRRGRHCEERSDVAIQIKFRRCLQRRQKAEERVWIASRHASLAVAMTGAGFYRNMLWQVAEKRRGCHCEERSDVAIQIKCRRCLQRRQKAEESLDCFPPRFARGRNDGGMLSSQNALTGR